MARPGDYANRPLSSVLNARKARLRTLLREVVLADSRRTAVRLFCSECAPKMEYCEDCRREDPSARIR